MSDIWAKQADCCRHEQFIPLGTASALLGIAVFTKAIVRPPAPNFAEGLTTADLGVPNYERALAQHEAYCQTLEQCGLTLTRLEPDERYPDSCFVEDTAILIEALPDGRATAPARGSDRCAVLTRPGARSRANEVASIKKVLIDFYADMLSIQPPGTVDGGDVCEAGDHFFIGISERTNEEGASQLAEMLASFGYTSNVVDIRSVDGILHLKSGIAWLGDQRLVVIDALAKCTALSKYDLVRVNDDEMYAANCVRVNDHVLVAAGYPVLEGKLREMGDRTIALDMTEFQKMDGGLSCLSLRF